MKRDYKTISLNSGGKDLNKLEKFIETICDEFYVYNDCYGNIVLSVISLFEKSIEQSTENKIITIDFYNDTKGLCFEIFPDNSKLITESQLVLAEKDSIIDDSSYDWLFILERLADNLEISHNSILIQFDIKSINAELAATRVAEWRNYILGNTVSKEKYSN